jgi:general secretion pathway protein E
MDDDRRSPHSEFGPHLPLHSLHGGTSRQYLLLHRVCPVGRSENGSLKVLVGPGMHASALQDLEFLYGCAVEVETVSMDELEQTIERLVTASERQVELRHSGAEDERLADVRQLAHDPPVIRYVNLLVREACDLGASDIHLESTIHGLRVRFRVDGVLTPAPEPPPSLHRAVVSRIKLLAELDISERRRPQDGRIRVRREDGELDLRVATAPTHFGESVVLRLLERGSAPDRLHELGMPVDILDRILAIAARPHGLILVTGPTGSGKTTTLYSVLRSRDAAREKIVTVEDPVEYQLEGVTQVPVHRQAGVTFPAALRSILRQDPDVVMIGEMRDPETAEIGIQASMTGHMVLSTLHTNDAPSAFARLLDLGVPGYLAASTIEGVLAQRLVRRVCAECSESCAAPPPAVGWLPATTANGNWVSAVGCATCLGTGYRGRVGIFELVVPTPELRATIAGGRMDGLETVCAATGYRPLLADGWSKAAAGITTAEEVLRVARN